MTSSSAPMSGDLASRLAQLTPAQRELLERKLREAGVDSPIGAATAATASVQGTSRVAPRTTSAPAPLTAAQELLWTLDQAMPGLPAYNVPRLLRIEGPLDVAALQRALDGLVLRHEALRTRFVATLEGPRQLADAGTAVPLDTVDVRALPDAGRTMASDRAIAAAARVAFDLAHDVLLRATLVREADERWRLLLLTHHIVSDEASRGIMLRELSTLYAAALEGRAATLPPLPIQFADYAAWQREALERGALADGLAHWRERLRGLRPLDLPTDRPRTNVSRAFEGARARRRLPSSVLELARQVAREHGVTLYATLLAAFNALMHRYTGAEDVGVASPVTGRGTPELEGLVGYFPNLLVMRTPVDPAQSFAALLRATRTTVLDAFEHQEVPLEAVVAEGVASVTPVCFTMQGEATATPPLGAARTSAELTDFGTAKFDLLFGAGERDGGLLVGVEYRVDLFDAATAERMLDHFATLLEAALRSPETAVSRLPILPAEERAQVLDRWNATARDYPQHATLVSLLAEQVARTPNAVAVSDERRVLTYAELDARATALAHRLRAQGAGRGVLVGVCAERSVELVIALVAVLRAGAAYVPLDPEYPRDRLAFMLDDAAVPVLLATRDLATRLATRAPLIALDDVADTAPLSGDLGALPAPLPGDPAYMIYTSGSTGRPKGAVNAHRGIVNRLLWMQEEYALGSQDAVLQKTPFSFDVSVWELFWPLLAGARLVMARAGGHRDPAYLADVITRERITVCHFVPSMLRAFLAGADVGACGSLRDVMASGEALAPDLVAAFNGVVPNARLHNLYGPTECAVDVTYWPCPRTSEPLRVVPIGRPVANTRMYVLDRAGEPTPIGVAGELHIAGVQVGLGYHGRPELTAERFPRDPFATGLTSSDASDARLYRTGDLARWRADGTIEYLGRLDFQVKVRGFRIELGEIEATLSRHAQVAAVVVVAPEDGSGTPRLVAYVVPRAPFSEAHSTEALWTSLRALAAESLPDHMVPNVFVALDTLPLTPSGKVDRKALPVPSVDMRRRDYVAPRTPSEVALARIWSEVLTLDKVGATHGFLELGGHSLAAMRVVARVRGDTNVVLPLAPLLRGDTLQQVAELLDAARRSQDDANAAAPDTEDEFALAPVARSAFRRAGRSGAGGPS